MNSDDRNDSVDPSRNDEDLGVPIHPESYDDAMPNDPESLDTSEETPELHSVNVPPYDEDYGDLPHADARPPLEPLNPWISMITRPRESIAYVLQSGDYANWVMIYSILYFLAMPPALLGIFVDPRTMEAITSENAAMLQVGILIGLCVAYAICLPIALGFMWAMGWAYSIIGGWLGGAGTPLECRIALVWAGAVGTYVSYIGMIPNAFAGVYYRMVDEITPGAGALVSLATMVVVFPFWIYTVIIHCKAVGEAHQFSAWLGFCVFLIFSAILSLVVFIPLFAIIFLVLIAAAA